MSQHRLPLPACEPDEAQALVQLLRRLAAVPEPQGLDSAGGGELRAEYFENNWREARDGLLARTRKIRVQPQPARAPTLFHFEMDRPFKRKRDDGQVELAPGPVRGVILYHPDPFSSVDGRAAVVVLIDPALGFHHPNCSRELGGAVCIGELHGTPALEPLLEHVWGIVCYANLTVSHPADAEASVFFSQPGAREGLPPAEPLY